jgi:hypothetical protein
VLVCRSERGVAKLDDTAAEVASKAEVDNAINARGARSLAPEQADFAEMATEIRPRNSEIGAMGRIVVQTVTVVLR